MAKETIGCSSRKTKLIDPNDFVGHSSDNFFVPLEELTISVQLKTTKRGRTVLSASNDKQTVASSDSVSVTFIEGTEINGKKVLTTKYTDLTTVFDNNESENLGITNIDIDFNSQQTPMITINFIDVRGSAIFQNEENIQGLSNKYSVFFQLPYPLYELTIKGYYGQAVTYCLHMLKFNSKFNANTGNFEVTAQFIGSTYAMLSDMLIGFLKAIPYTKIGKDLYDEVNADRKNGPILNLNELMVKIGNVNETIEKVKKDELSATVIGKSDSKYDTINVIKQDITSLWDDISIVKVGDDTGNSIHEFIFTDYPTNKTLEGNIQGFKDNVVKSINIFNTDNTVSINEDIFTSLDKYLVLGVTKDELDGTRLLTDGELKEFADKFKISVNEAIPKRVSLINNLKTEKINSVINVFDLKPLYDELDRAKTSFDVVINNNKKELANVIRFRVAEAIGFEPTVRNIVEVFTVAVEVFLKAIYLVSYKASTNDERTAELKKVFNEKEPQKSDLNKYSQIIYHPWPDYRQKEDNKGYIETYLGSAGVVNANKIDELIFIDDLLLAFLKANQIEADADNAVNQVQKVWAAISPLDTKLFTDKYPYKRLKDGGLNKEDVLNLMVIRAMTFLGYTNASGAVEDTDILKMAEEEASSVLTDISNDTVRTSLNTVKLEDFSEAVGTLDGERKKIVNVFVNNQDYYSYDYMHTPYSIDRQILVDGNFNTLKRNFSDLLLTNYSDTQFDYSVEPPKPLKKIDDGGLYLKIFPIENYNQISTSFARPIDNSEDIISFAELSKSGYINPKLAGFSVFGGKFGIQDFNKMDFGYAVLNELPLMYVFYDDRNDIDYFSTFTTKDKDTFKNIYNWVCKNRENSNIKKTNFDLRTPSGALINEITVIHNTNDVVTSSEVMVHDDIKKTLESFSGIKKGIPNTYPYINYVDGTNKISYNRPNFSDFFSLFGNIWYYAQQDSKYPEYSKAFLFLQTFPFRGDSFENNVIFNLFSKKGGFVHAPKLWCAYIGSLIWRADTEEPVLDGNKITSGGSGKNDPIVWFNGTTPISVGPLKTDEIPSRDSYINALFILKSSYKEYSKFLTTLPDQVKNEFKRMFFEFVNDDFANYSWSKFKENLEIWTGSTQGYITKINTIYNNVTLVNNKPRLKTSYLSDLKNFDKYNVISPYNTKDGTNIIAYKGLFLELRGDYQNGPVIGKPNIVRDLIDAMMEEVVIANNSYAIWDSRSLDINPGRLSIREPILVQKSKFDLYFKKVLEIFNTNSTSAVGEQKAAENKIFGTSNEDIIKLQLYRHCKNIYDKWVGGSTSIDNILFKCEGGNKLPLRNSIDSELANKYQSSSKPKLIDSFRFVTRSFKDIGDKLFINPTPVNTFLHDNPNVNVYHAITELISANYFTFTPLPTFINYKDEETLKNVFRPQTYVDAIENGVCGPSFVCVYVGQNSKNLDITEKSSPYSPDGIDIRCKDGQMSILPDDFSEEAATFEEIVPVFEVNYSQQNQNIFKDITLDQSEFGETAESLLIVDEITQQGGENNRTLAGQNIFNVYSVRSYKSEIEMMGNAMIQPMMYYQLNNIPMFHGAYMITRVKHNIKPNYMSTTFTGVRVRFPETKVFDASDLYMSIIDSIGLGGASGTTSTTINSIAPIIKVIMDNLGVNGKFVAGLIKAKPLKKIKGLADPYNKISNKTENQLLAEAVPPLELMLNDWIKYMIDAKFKGNNGNYASITSLFRPIEKQQELKNEAIAKGDPKSAAEPGFSNHGWGIAIDLQFYDMAGNVIPNDNNNKDGFDVTKNPALKWLLDNSYKYGWIIPAKLRDNSGRANEYWHFEYHGRWAKCLYSLNNVTYGYVADVSGAIKEDIVKNPIDAKTQAPAIVDGCQEILTAVGGDGAPINTKLNSKELAQNQITVKNLLKGKGISQAQAAGVMGNMQVESTFNPSRVNKMDSNGLPSVGLIQWNANTATWKDFGYTVESQTQYMYTFLGRFDRFLSNSRGMTDPSQTAFMFAKYVEVCYKCNTDNFQNVFLSEAANTKRASYANDFMIRMSDKKDPLFWG